MRSALSVPQRWLLVIVSLTALVLFLAPASSADPIETYCPTSWVITDEWTHPHYTEKLTVPDQSAPWIEWWQYYQDVRDASKIAQEWSQGYLILNTLRSNGTFNQIVDSATLCYLQKAGGFSYSQALTLVEAFGIANEGRR